MKYFNYVIGLIGSFVASLFGGWSLAIETLLLFMAIDYITGLIVAGLFNNSPKTDTGGLKSSIGFKGLCRKGMILLYVLIAYRIDLVLGVNYIKDCICIAFGGYYLFFFFSCSGRAYREDSGTFYQKYR